MYFICAEDIKDLSEPVFLDGMDVSVSGSIQAEDVCVYIHNRSYSSPPKCKVLVWTWLYFE